MNYFDYYRNYYSKSNTINTYANKDRTTYYSRGESSTVSMLEEVLLTIKNSVNDEREDEAFYEFLIRNAKDEEDKEIIASIRDDEKKHGQMLRRIYFELTGEQLMEPMQNGEINFNMSYLDGLKKALFGELGAVEKYRKVMFAMNDKEKYNDIMEIMTDEMKHGIKYNYLISKNR